MKRKLPGVLLAVLMVAMVFVLTACDYPIGGEHQHEWSDWETIKNPDCQNPGIAERLCDCGETQQKNIPVVAHKYGDWKETKTPTCEEKGEESRSCIYCDKAETRETSALGHDKVQHEGKDATCAEAGYEAYETCTRCDYTTYEEIPITNEHTYAEWIDEVPPTTEKEGTLGHYHCSVCEKNFDADKKELDSIVIPKLDDENPNPTPNPDPKPHEHTESDWIVDKEATCTEEGSQYKKCTECGEELDRDPIQKTKHNPSGWIVNIEPTYEAEGHKYKNCTKCGEVIEEETIPKLLASDNHYIYYYDNYGVEIKEESWPECFAENEGLHILPQLEIAGYQTETNYWRDEYGNRVWSIPVGTNKDVRLFAVPGELELYTITYDHAPINNNRTTYTIKDEFTLLDAEWEGLKFDYWTDDNGERITHIEKGSTGHKTLTAHWIYKENYAVESNNDAPIDIFYIDKEGRYYFIYELGTIYDVVLKVAYDEVKYLGQSLAFEKSSTITIEDSIADSIADTVSNSVSKTEEWNETKEWAQSASVSVETSFSAGFEGGCDYAKATIESSIGISTGMEASEGIGYGYSHSNEITDTTERTVSSTVTYSKGTSTTFSTTTTIGESMPAGMYKYVCTGNVTVYAVVTYDITTGNYYLDTFNVISEELEDKWLYEATRDITADIRMSDELAFDVPTDEIEEYVNSFYFVQYDANGGNGEMPVSAFGVNESHSLLPNTFQKDGYIFVGWSLEENGNVVYFDGDTVSNITEPGKTITLYASWKPINYNILFDPNGGSGTMSISVHTYNETKALPENAYVNSGYVFESWNTEKDGSGTRYENKETVKNLSTTHNDFITLYAQWKQCEYSVTFITNGGTALNQAIIAHNSPVVFSNYTTTRDGYTFDGWYKDPSFNTKYSDSYTNSSNLDLVAYAKWTAIPYNCNIVFSGVFDLNCAPMLLITHNDGTKTMITLKPHIEKVMVGINGMTPIYGDKAVASFDYTLYYGETVEILAFSYSYTETEEIPGGMISTITYKVTHKCEYQKYIISGDTSIDVVFTKTRSSPWMS